MAKEKWLDEEMILTLAFYKFDDKCYLISKIKSFTDKLNLVTKVNRSYNAVNLRIANYKAIDPDYSGRGMTGGGKIVQEFFDEYVTNDPSLTKLARIYSNFLNGEPLEIKNGGLSTSASNSELKTKVVSTVVYNRSEKVKNATLNRSGGVCELCGNTAPFNTPEGKPYLEVHHVIALSENGIDQTSNTLALCPNCHRRLHYGGPWTPMEEKIISDILLKALKELE